MTTVDAVRRFNRFYTREIGLLGRHLPESDYSLAEARVLYELAHRDESVAADLGRELAMDRAQMSRLLARFRAAGLLRTRVSPEHARRQLLSLTAAGRRAVGALERAATAQMGALFSPLDSKARRRVVGAMREIEGILAAPIDAPPTITLRRPRVGELGWIIHRQAQLYHEEYGWDWTFEGLIAGIMAEFVAGFDPQGEDVWVADVNGEVAGSIFLVKSERVETAKLRLLYVEPSARGYGLGRRLVRACIARARELGYRELTLWTNDVLTAARRIYETEGFVLVSESVHQSFGHRLTGQNWSLDLAVNSAPARLTRKRRAGSSTKPASSARRRSR